MVFLPYTRVSSALSSGPWSVAEGGTQLTASSSWFRARKRSLWLEMMDSSESTWPSGRELAGAEGPRMEGQWLGDLPVAPQDEAGLTKTFQTWPRGWFHIP